MDDIVKKFKVAKGKTFSLKDHDPKFTDDFNNTYCDIIQIISVEDLLEGKRPLIKQSRFETFKKAEKKLAPDLSTLVRQF